MPGSGHDRMNNRVCARNRASAKSRLWNAYIKPNSVWTRQQIETWKVYDGMGERQNKARAAEGHCHRHDSRELLSRGLPACSAEEESSRMRPRNVAKDMAVEAAPRDRGEVETRQRVKGSTARKRRTYGETYCLRMPQAKLSQNY